MEITLVILTIYFSMPTKIPSLHCPVYMQVLLDPTMNLLACVNELPMTTTLCELHSNENLMLKAQKLTSIIHEIYPTESDRPGYYVDNDNFSFEGTSTLATQKIIKEQKKKILAVARHAGIELQYEHNLYDAKIKQNVEPNFTADWFEISSKFYEHGPPLIHMPIDIIQTVTANRLLELDVDPETTEETFKLRFDDMTN